MKEETDTVLKLRLPASRSSIIALAAYRLDVFNWLTTDTSVAATNLPPIKKLLFALTIPLTIKAPAILVSPPILT